MWHMMMRVGGIHTLNVEEYDLEDQYLGFGESLDCVRIGSLNNWQPK